MLKRPRALEGVTYEVPTGCGSLYVTVSFLNGKPFEVFCRMGKVGGCSSAQNEALGRLLSTALRHGTPAEELAKQLQHIRCSNPTYYEGEEVLSCADAVAKVLKEVLSESVSHTTNPTA